MGSFHLHAESRIPTWTRFGRKSYWVPAPFITFLREEDHAHGRRFQAPSLAVLPIPDESLPHLEEGSLVGFA